MTQTVDKIDRWSAAELKWAKRWIRRARGGPSEGWSSKTAPDEPEYEVLSPESEPCTHTRTHASTRGRQAAREELRVTERVELFFGRVSTDV